MTDSIITADQIAAYRKRKGWSQDRLGRELGISQVAVCRYENGGAIPGPTQQLLRIWINEEEDDPSATPLEPQEA